MRERFEQLYKDKGLADDTRWYRVGMHTGAATLGNVGSTNRRDFTAIGDTINLAKRLEENTTAGQIILSEDTIDACFGPLMFKAVVRGDQRHFAIG